MTARISELQKLLNNTQNAVPREPQQTSANFEHAVSGPIFPPTPSAAPTEPDCISDSVFAGPSKHASGEAAAHIIEGNDEDELYSQFLSEFESNPTASLGSSKSTPNHSDRGSVATGSSKPLNESGLELTVGDDMDLDADAPPASDDLWTSLDAVVTHHDDANDGGSDADLWDSLGPFDFDHDVRMDDGEYSDDSHITVLDDSELQPKADVQIPETTQQCPYYPEITQKLKTVFKLSIFRPNQLEAVVETMSGRDVFVLMPTGGGKSLCYQLPAVCKTGTTKGVSIVVSPLLALMENQESALKAKGVDVLSWNSGSGESHEITERLKGSHKPALLYVSPEKLEASHALQDILSELYENQQLARFVIDEAHCISTWGQDFRAAYRGLGRLRDDYPDVPIIALTATANKHTVNDIMQRLKLRNPATFTQSFNRANLAYYIYPKRKRVGEDIFKFIQDRHRNETGIIYCHERKTCEKVAKTLRDKGLSAKHFHANMNARDKTAIQEGWQSDSVLIIVATVSLFSLPYRGDSQNYFWIDCFFNGRGQVER